jgi:hypothetical protein
MMRRFVARPDTFRPDHGWCPVLRDPRFDRILVEVKNHCVTHPFGELADSILTREELPDFGDEGIRRSGLLR